MSDETSTLAAVTAALVNGGRDTATVQLSLNDGRYICDIDVQLLRVEDTEQNKTVFFQPVTRYVNGGAVPATTH